MRNILTPAPSIPALHCPLRISWHAARMSRDPRARHATRAELWHAAVDLTRLETAELRDALQRAESGEAVYVRAFGAAAQFMALRGGVTP